MASGWPAVQERRTTTIRRAPSKRRRERTPAASPAGGARRPGGWGHGDSPTADGLLARPANASTRTGGALTFTAAVATGPPAPNGVRVANQIGVARALHRCSGGGHSQGKWIGSRGRAREALQAAVTLTLRRAMRPSAGVMHGMQSR